MLNCNWLFVTLTRDVTSSAHKFCCDALRAYCVAYTPTRGVKQLLLETDMPLEQIATLTGYSHKEGLLAVFRRDQDAFDRGLAPR